MARFPRRARLLKPGELKHTFDGGRRASVGCLTAVHVISGNPAARLGLAIAKKNVPSAVDRNRLKRAIRESFRHHRHLLPPADIVVLTRPGSDKNSPAQLRELLERLWTRIAASSKA